MTITHHYMTCGATTCGRCVMLLLAAISVGCASRPGGGSANPDNQRTPALELLAGNSMGLEVRQWSITHPPADLGPRLEMISEGVAVPKTVSERLRRNGLRLLRVPLSALDDLRRELGTTTLDLEAWHGQVFRWRSLFDRPLSEQRVTLAVDGRVGSFRPGSLQLKGRAWIAPMEDGPQLVLQLVPVIFRQVATVVPAWMPAQPPDQDAFDTLRTEWRLESGYGYVLAAAPPSSDWAGDDDDGTDARDDQHAVSTGLGPGVMTPPTIGERLLTHDGQPAKIDLLIFVAHLGPPARTTANLHVEGKR